MSKEKIAENIEKIKDTLKECVPTYKSPEEINGDKI